MTRNQVAASRYEKRAEELRTIASGMRDGKYRDELLKWAEEYEQWAQRANDRASISFPDGQPKQPD